MPQWTRICLVGLSKRSLIFELDTNQREMKTRLGIQKTGRLSLTSSSFSRFFSIAETASAKQTPPSVHSSLSYILATVTATNKELSTD